MKKMQRRKKKKKCTRRRHSVSQHALHHALPNLALDLQELGPPINIYKPVTPYEARVASVREPINQHIQAAPNNST